MTFGQKLRLYLAAAKTAATPGTWNGDAWVKAVDVFYAGQVKERKKAAVAEGAEEIYALYPKHVGKEDALKAITAALKNHPAGYLLDKTGQFAAAVGAWPSSYRYFQDGGDRCPHPATWFNSGRYADDPREWRRAGSRSAGPVSKSSSPAQDPKDVAKAAQDDAEALTRILASPEPQKGTLAHSLWLEAHNNAVVESVVEAVTAPVKVVENERRLRNA